MRLRVVLFAAMAALAACGGGGGGTTVPSTGGGGTTSTPTSAPSQTASPSPAPTYTSTPGLLFSQYKDVTIDAGVSGAQQTAVTGSTQSVTSAMPVKNKVLNWAFATGTCGSEMWGSFTPAQEATNISTFTTAGDDYIISTGGYGGTFTCPTTAAFLSFVNTYYTANMLGVDFDIETTGSGQSLTQAQVDQLVADVQAEQAVHPNMRFSFTVATGGGSATILSTEGQEVMTSISKFNLTGAYTINLMTMDYYAGSPPASSSCVVVGGACEMGQSAVQAATNLHTTYGTPYSHIEITPMIGGNDDTTETFTLADADTVSAFVLANGLAGVHFWSLDRDVDCAPGPASSTCNTYGSGGTLGFTNEFITKLGL